MYNTVAFKAVTFKDVAFKAIAFKGVAFKAFPFKPLHPTPLRLELSHPNPPHFTPLRLKPSRLNPAPIKAVAIKTLARKAPAIKAIAVQALAAGPVSPRLGDRGTSLVSPCSLAHAACPHMALLFFFRFTNTPASCTRRFPPSFPVSHQPRHRAGEAGGVIGASPVMLMTLVRGGKTVKLDGFFPLFLNHSYSSFGE